jgi:hypothetical protein
LINYNQLSVPVIFNLLSFFKVSLTAQEMETIASGSRFYSKASSQSSTFVADTNAKQQLASTLVREMAEAWANEPYRLLEQKRVNSQ